MTDMIGLYVESKNIVKIIDAEGYEYCSQVKIRLTVTDIDYALKKLRKIFMQSFVHLPQQGFYHFLGKEQMMCKIMFKAWLKGKLDGPIESAVPSKPDVCCCDGTFEGWMHCSVHNRPSPHSAPVCPPMFSPFGQPNAPGMVQLPPQPPFVQQNLGQCQRKTLPNYAHPLRYLSNENCIKIVNRDKKFYVCIECYNDIRNNSSLFDDDSFVSSIVADSLVPIITLDITKPVPTA